MAEIITTQQQNIFNSLTEYFSTALESLPLNIGNRLGCHPDEVKPKSTTGEYSPVNDSFSRTKTVVIDGVELEISAKIKIHASNPA